MLRQATLVLVAATALTPVAAAGRYTHAATPTTPRPPAQHVVVRTELVPGAGGFHWADAALGFGVALVSGAVLLAVFIAGGGRRHARRAKSAS